MKNIRVRTTAGAVVVVGVALLIGAVTLVLTMRRNLTDEVRTAADLRAEDLADELESGTAPNDLPVGNEDDTIVQVVDRDGDVVAASPNAVGYPPVARIDPDDSATIDPPVADDGEYLAVATAAHTEPEALVVIVARSLEDVDQSTQFVSGMLALGLPLLLLLVGFTTWKVVGRALAPVEAIRNEVDEISAAELHRRVPQPEGGDEIARLASTMNRMLDRLEESHTRQRRFVSDASHELRSPVAIIRQHAEVALAHPDRMSTADLAETVLAEDLRVQRLVEDLLLLTRADERMLHLAVRPVDLDDLVFDEARRLRETSTLRVDTHAVSAGRVMGDIHALDRILRNITGNAARHARAQISFALTERDGSVLLTVDDDGPGVAPDDRAGVFERFVRLDDARARDDGGSGLGLAIVAELVGAHGGTVRLTESPLGGARIEVRIQAASADSQQR